MKKTIAAILLFPCAIFADDCPEVSNVNFSQNSTGSRDVEITYTLDNAPGIVTVDVLTNGVSIGGEHMRFLGGDVNRLVEKGSRIIAWKCGKDWPGQKIDTESVVVEVSAWATNNPPPYMVTDLVTGDLRWYPSAEALPQGGVTNELYKTQKLVMRRIPASEVEWIKGQPGMTSGPHTARQVTLSQDYWIGVYPLTRRQYALILNPAAEATTEPCMQQTQITYNYMRTAQDAWSSAITWPQTLHTVAEESPLGKLRARVGNKIEFDLPTDAQWEFACRGGTSSAYFWGDNKEDGTEVYAHTQSEEAVVVGMLLPNQFGLYDMLGSCSEFTLDWYSASPSRSPERDPLGASEQYQSNREWRCRRGSAGLKCYDQIQWGNGYSANELQAHRFAAPL